MPRVVRVLPDVGAIDRSFDYEVPDALGDAVRVGSIVRVVLHGRRVRGWVVEDDVVPTAGVRLLPVAKVTGWGPDADVVDLTAWAAARWAGPRAHFLATASPLTAVRGLPPPTARVGRTEPPEPADPLVADALARRRAVLRLPPAEDVLPIVLSAVATVGPDRTVLCVVPSSRLAADLARRLRARGDGVALVPREWARARAGAAVVVGARAAAFAPAARLGAAIVIDAHDEALQEERAPTWTAWQVVAERAARAGAPCLLVSPCPTLDLLTWSGEAGAVIPPRARERAGWPVVDVVDRRAADPREGLWSPRAVQAVRSGGLVVCVLNRKGRARLLACGACNDLVRCESCDGPVAQESGGDLVCRRCGAARPAVCASCGSQRLKALRLGVTRAREELEALAGRPVGEVTAGVDELPAADVLIGTEAVLHRVERADVVVFADLDQELLAPRFRAGEQAMALVARAARLVGGRDGGGRLVLQTRLPRHAVVESALHADPGRLAAAETPVRASLALPPHTALARISGAAAPEYVAALDRDAVSVGPDGDGFLVRAAATDVLTAALAAVPRPGGRLRVEVDPLRV